MNLRKCFAIILICTVFVTSTPIYSYAQNIQVNEFIEGLENVEILEETNDIVTAKAIEDGIEVVITIDKNTCEVLMNSKTFDKKTKMYKEEEDTFKVQVDIDNLEEVNLIGEMEYDGESYNLEDIPEYKEKNVARAAVALPLVTILGSSLLKWLINQFFYMVVAGVTYVTASAVVDTIRKKNYDHYLARLENGKLVIGNSITYSTAISRMKSSKTGNVWSRTSALAKKVATGAGGGKPAIGSEIHNKNKPRNQLFYYHYHTYNRTGGHSFYGAPLKGTI